MGKYYVKSGRVRKIVHGPSRKKAALDVIDQETRVCDGELLPIPALSHLGLVTEVSERGFRSKDTNFYPTHCVMFRTGMFGQLDADDQEPDKQEAN